MITNTKHFLLHLQPYIFPADLPFFFLFRHTRIADLVLICTRVMTQCRSADKKCFSAVWCTFILVQCCWTVLGRCSKGWGLAGDCHSHLGGSVAPATAHPGSDGENGSREGTLASQYKQVRDMWGATADCPSEANDSMHVWVYVSSNRPIEHEKHKGKSHTFK